MSLRKILCCCQCGDGREILNESGSTVNRGDNSVIDNLPEAEDCGNVEENKLINSNPRNKCALKPGHSHIDWVRLSNSKDLTGLGEKAGKLEVTLEELAKHNKITDAWLALNGKVYNVTSYFPFHPGGVDELRRGLGIDATKLFYEVHNWVNYDSLLKSCYVGRLLTSPRMETSTPVLPPKNPQPQISPNATDQPPTPQPGSPSQPGPSTNGTAGQPGPSTNGTAGQPIDIVRNGTNDSYPRGLKQESPEIRSFQSFHEDPEMELTTTNFYNKYQNQSSVQGPMPRFHWVQKSTLLCVSFTIKRFSNPLVEVKRLGKQAIQVVLCFDKEIFVNDFLFTAEVLWPCHMRLIEEDGMIELTFKKAVEVPWENFGQLRQMKKIGEYPENSCVNYEVRSKEEIAANVFLIELQRTDGIVISVPVGHHIRVFSEDGSFSRSYTPIPKPKTMFPKPANATWASDSILLVVKRYENGNISKALCDAAEGTAFLISRPVVPPDFKLVKLHDKDRFICLAAGTGITPMLSMMLAMLQRRSRKCLRFSILFCNRTKEDIPFLEEYRELIKLERTKNNRICIKHILSDAEIPKEPDFFRGPLDIDHVRTAVDEIYRPRKNIEDDLFVFVCGPKPFNETCQKLLKEVQVPDDQIYIFQE